MQRSNRRALATLAFVATLFTSLPAPGADDNGFDIVGLRLGMTPEQAMQVLKTHGVDAQSINETRSAYGYSDGVKHDYRTEDFVLSVMAVKVENISGKRRNDGFKLYFSPPPAGGRLVGVSRVLTNSVDPITNSAFREALQGKYGKPTNTVLGIQNWKFGSGTMNCLSSSPHGTGVAFPSTERRNQSSILDQVFMKSGSSYQVGVFRVSRVKQLDACANMLEYAIHGGDTAPATRVQASMVDVQSWVKAELAANEQLATLRKNAVEKRIGKGGKPTL